MQLDFLKSCKDLRGALTSESQNGKSVWGTLAASTLPLWIVGHGGSHGDHSGHGGYGDHGPCPWGDRTAGSSNPYKDGPVTGLTRTYEFNLSRGVIAPDGYAKHVMLINDQFPGPLVEANWGDWIEVKVNNLLTDEPPEGTSIHWHGFLQHETPWMDGPPGVAQCPIAPGKTFTYKFRAEIYGTTWYHSHYSAQYSGGLFGPMVIYGPRNVDYDIDLGPIMVSDWWHEEYFTVVEEVMSPGFSGYTSSDNNLISGRMNFDCDAAENQAEGGDNNNENENEDETQEDSRTSSKRATARKRTACTENAGLSKFQFTPGKAHRLRFINSGSQGVERVSLDGHMMTVMAQDFVEVEPYDTPVVTLGIGQRVDVVIQARDLTSEAETADASNTSTGDDDDHPSYPRSRIKSSEQSNYNPDPRLSQSSKTTSAFWLRANLTRCSGAKQPYAMAAVYYKQDDTEKDPDTDAIPDSEPWDVPDPGTCANDPLELTRPYYPIALKEPSWTQHMDIGIYRNASGNLLWTFGGKSGRVNYDDPTLLQTLRGDTEFDPINNVHNYGTNTSIRFIVNNPTHSYHPIHAHGLNMFVLAAGPGPFDIDFNTNTTNHNRNTTDNSAPTNTTLSPSALQQIAAIADNPPRRDVQNVQPGGHIVLQMDVENPGIWPFHCHIAWHASAGFFSQMLFLPDDIVEFELVEDIQRVCDEWHAFTGSEVVEQIDSGL